MNLSTFTVQITQRLGCNRRRQLLYIVNFNLSIILFLIIHLVEIIDVAAARADWWKSVYQKLHSTCIFIHFTEWTSDTSSGQNFVITWFTNHCESNMQAGASNQNKILLCVDMKEDSSLVRWNHHSLDDKIKRHHTNKI